MIFNSKVPVGFCPLRFLLLIKKPRTKFNDFKLRSDSPTKGQTTQGQTTQGQTTKGQTTKGQRTKGQTTKGQKCEKGSNNKRSK